MTQEDFEFQWKRLKIRFGDKAFDEEFKKLVVAEVLTMPASDFREAVNVWIGNRQHKNPPLLVDFRDARLAIEKRKFNNQVTDSAATLSASGINSGALEDKMEEMFGPGIKTPLEALELVRTQKLVKEAFKEDDKPQQEDDGVLEF